MSYLPYVLLALLGGAVFAACYWFLSWMLDDGTAEKTVSALMERTGQAEEERARQQRELLAREGKQEKVGPAAKIDILILQSGIKRRLPFLNTTFLFLMTILGAGAVGFFTFTLTNRILYAVIGTILVPILLFLGLKLSADANYRKAEEGLIPFLDLVGNFSLTNDDLISIFERIVPYLENPLRNAVSDCCLEARATGNIPAALQNLSLSIGHEQFQMIIQNLDICSRYTNNIPDIVKDCRIMLTQYAAAKKERHSLVANARVELLMLIGMSGFVIYMVGGMTEGVSMAELMLSTLPGQGICLFCAVVIGYGIKTLFVTDRGKG